MTLYVVAYYDNGWNMSEIMLNLSQAQNALTWFQSQPGTSYVVILSWTTTNVSNWGTPPV